MLGRVEVAGCIASGKTTFVNALAGHRLMPVYEDHTVNPFWKAFYSDPSGLTRLKPKSPSCFSTITLRRSRGLTRKA